MAHRRYIQTAEPYAQINSTCYVAAVQLNTSHMKRLIPVYLPEGRAVPTNQNQILRDINGVDNGLPEAERTGDVVSMVQAGKETEGSSIDGQIAEYAYWRQEHKVTTWSF